MNFSKEILGKSLSPESSLPNWEKGATKEEFFEKSNDLHDTPLGKIIGQTFNSYIVVETSEGMKILDQHALAERVIYEKLVKNFASPNIQGLLIAESFSLTPKEFEIVENYKEIFLEM
jgi:DNA mismatch repair protein MutL